MMTKIPPKRRREFKVGQDVVVFSPVIREPGCWVGRQYPIYRVLLNGSDIAWIEYERGTRAGHRLLTNGVGWTRLLTSKSWPSPTQVRSLSPFTLETFADIAAQIPAWAASGKVMTKEQQAVAVAEWQAVEDRRDAEIAATRQAQQVAMAQQRERDLEAKGEMLEGLRSIRDRMAGTLTNFEASGLEAAIRRLS